MKTGKWVQQSQGGFRYEAFIPNTLPPVPPLIIDNRMYTKLSSADRFLARLDGICEVLPDVYFFILMYVRKEAASSSRIEGTLATMGDALRAEVNLTDPAMPSDVNEILNYVAAMNHGTARLDSFPLSLRLISELHSVLMENVRGHDKAAGEFRNSQNRIGGDNIERATYVPPPVGELMPLLDNFEKFIHGEDELPALIKTALIHSQFEMIHPFNDGNGRVGRLLITLYLYDKKILRKPLLYLSDYFARYRDEYYNRLGAVSKYGDIEGWIMFFLDAVKAISEEAVDLSRKIIALRERDRSRLHRLGTPVAANARKLLDNLYHAPLIDAEKVRNITGLKGQNAYNLINRMMELDILKQTDGYRKRNRFFIYKEYVDLFA